MLCNLGGQNKLEIFVSVQNKFRSLRTELGCPLFSYIYVIRCVNAKTA